MTYKPWYKASGTMGMAQALAAANDAATGGYTLADRGTWLNATALGTTTNLKVVNERDAVYFNQYSVIEVDRRTELGRRTGLQQLDPHESGARADSDVRRVHVSRSDTVRAQRRLLPQRGR